MKGIKMEQGKKYYDAIYAKSVHYRKKATQINYYPIWKHLIQDLAKREINCLLDLGSGVGQFAAAIPLHHKKLEKYIGLDFSTKAIQMAKSKKLPNSLFYLENLNLPKWPRHIKTFGKSPYAVIALEVLEHLKGDLAILQKIPKGSQVYLSVPSYWSRGHVRVFNSEAEVRKRYQGLVEIESVETFLLPKGKPFFELVPNRVKEGTRIYLFKGKKK